MTTAGADRTGRGLVLILAALAVWLGGCAAVESAVNTWSPSYAKQSEAMRRAYAAGDWAAAAHEAAARSAKSDGRDAIVWRLELGTVLFTTGDLDGSLAAFEEAEERIAEHDERAKTSVSQEAKAALTNLSHLPYEGYHYDRIMLNTYKALIYLEKREFDAARVELIRALERQREAVAHDAKRIEARAAAAEEGKQNSVDVERAQQDKRYQDAYAEHFAGLDQYAAYADSVNPYCELLQALYFACLAAESSDLERAATSARRLAGMCADNPWCGQDLEMIEAMAQGGSAPPLTYVIFETGMAPLRESIRIDVPLFLVNDHVDYVGASFPKLVEQDDFVGKLQVRTADGAFDTHAVCDMDRVVAQEFKSELPTVITKTLIATAVKAAAQYGVHRATEGNQWANIIARAAGGIYQVHMNRADLRTWQTLPKRVQYCRLATPADGVVSLECPVAGTQTIRLDGNGPHVILVRSTSTAAPLVVRHFSLNPEAQLYADAQ